MPSRPPYRLRGRFGFTLVELLVVIGIIALLISILLPALSKARKSALTVKCASALRQVGMGFQLYGNDAKGWWPVAKYTPGATPYNIEGFDFTTGQPAYWFNFVGTYVNQAQAGYAITTGMAAAQVKKSVLFGCPAFEPYTSSTGVGISVVQPGYGMNKWPTYTHDTPAAGGSVGSADGAEINLSDLTKNGKFFKNNQWPQAAERALVMDSRFWLAESLPAPTMANYPAAIVPQPTINNQVTYSPGATGQTMADIYRHGTYPTSDGTNNGTFDPNGGNIAWNILYCDGHVSTTSIGKDAYLSLRQRFPG